jgi:hypothetical protein
MALLETLPNADRQKRLARLAAELDRLAADDAPARPTLAATKAQRYPAAEAIVEVLGEAGIPLRICEIHTAVEKRLGRSISRATVKSFLLYSSKGAKPRLERLSRGQISAEHAVRDHGTTRRVSGVV